MTLDVVLWLATTIWHPPNREVFFQHLQHLTGWKTDQLSHQRASSCTRHFQHSHVPVVEKRERTFTTLHKYCKWIGQFKKCQLLCGLEHKDYKRAAPRNVSLWALVKAERRKKTNLPTIFRARQPQDFVIVFQNQLIIHMTERNQHYLCCCIDCFEKEKWSNWESWCAMQEQD